EPALVGRVLGGVRPAGAEQEAQNLGSDPDTHTHQDEKDDGKVLLETEHRSESLGCLWVQHNSMPRKKARWESSVPIYLSELNPQRAHPSLAAKGTASRKAGQRASHPDQP